LFSRQTVASSKEARIVLEKVLHEDVHLVVRDVLNSISHLSILELSKNLNDSGNIGLLQK
jgi:hypothetical protein